MPKISEDYEEGDDYNMQRAIETERMEFADLTGSIICSQLQTLRKVERVWKNAKQIESRVSLAGFTIQTAKMRTRSCVLKWDALGNSEYQR